MMPVSRPRSARPRTASARAAAALTLAAALLSGCGTLASLDSAARPLATYELTPVAAAGASLSSVGRTIFVDMPTASGALSTDRIVIKPGPRAVTFLPDARWVDAAPLHLQQLVTRSLTNSGRLGFVTTRAVGPLADYTLITDIEAFQAEVGPAGGPPVTVRVRLTASLLRDADARLVATRRFEQRVGVPTEASPDIVAAFDAATTAVLQELTSWTVAVATGGGGV